MKSNKKQARKKREAETTFAYRLFAGFLFDFLFDLEGGSNKFLRNVSEPPSY
jgi:hypothetical protein